MPEIGFSQLVGRAKAGDRDALRSLLAGVEPSMERLARSFADPARPEESASDLLQEAKVRAWQRLGQFDGGEDDDETEARFRAWVLQIVRRTGLNAVDARRALKRGGERRVVRFGDLARRHDGASGSLDAFDPAGSEPTASAEARRRESDEILHAALDAYPEPIGRELVWLSFFEERSLREAARDLAVPYARARERFHEALRRLERELRGRL